jgi:hypothetical protein
MLQRFLTQAQTACREDVDYLLDKVDRITGDARRSARVAESA